MLVRALLKALILPPALQLLGVFLAWLCWRRWPHFSRLVLGASIVSLTLLASPIVAGALIASLEREYKSLATADFSAPLTEKAIVILGGGSIRDSLEYEGDTVNYRTLERLRYGAKIQRLTQLPVLVSGGSVFYPDSTPEAEMMSAVLEQEFGVPVAWREDRSQTTAENAFYSALLLREQGIDCVFLVTHSWHMHRAAAVFRKAGLSVMPAPLGLSDNDEITVVDVVPSPKALLQSYFALHEWLGYWIYRIQGLI